MWDWDIESDQVYIGDSIEEVFGYKLKNNTIHFSVLEKNFFAGDQGRVKEGLAKALVSAHNWEDSFMIRCKDGTIASVNSRAGIIRNAEGKAIRLIGATQDISKMLQLEKDLGHQVSVNQNADIFHLAAKLSYDGIWDWNILTNEFFLGEGFGEIFGHSFATSNKNFDWVNYLHPDDKEAVETGLFAALASSVSHWEHAYRFVKADGSFANVFGRANIIRDADGKACRMIGVIHDLSRQQELEKKLEQEIASNGKLLTEYNESFRLMFNSSSDILYDIDVVTNEIVLSEGYEKEFGYKIVPHMKPGQVWKEHLHPDDKEAVVKDYQRMLASDETRWKSGYRFLRSDGSVANILSSRIILRNADGKAYRMIGSMQDISKQKVLEEKLEQEIKLKEKQIADAMEDAKEAERSDIGKELHDNVNQLLGVSRLYLEMAKQGGDQSEMHLRRSSEYTLSAIEEIRKLTKGLTTDTIRHLGLCESIENLSRDAMQVNPLNILCTLDLRIESLVNDRFKLNIFRIIQEQLNNILKHARAKKVIINLFQNDQSILLVISDDGVGFDAAQKRKGIGIDNIKSRAAAYNGKADFASQPGAGCVLTVVFTLSAVLLRAE
jgi:PAS domain S-box-containing protein